MGVVDSCLISVITILMQAREPADSTLVDAASISQDLSQNVLSTLQKSLSDGCWLTRRPSRVDNHQVLPACTAAEQ
jgi:hypothetical protein